MQRFVEIGEWIYEIKLVKAVKTPKYGQPYTAICYLNFIDDRVTVESLLSKEQLTKFDFKTHLDFVKKMSVSSIEYDRYHNGKKRKEQVII